MPKLSTFFHGEIRFHGFPPMDRLLAKGAFRQRLSLSGKRSTGDIASLGLTDAPKIVSGYHLADAAIVKSFR